MGGVPHIFYRRVILDSTRNMRQNIPEPGKTYQTFGKQEGKSEAPKHWEKASQAGGPHVDQV